LIRFPAKLVGFAAVGLLLVALSGCSCCSSPLSGSFWRRWPDQGDAPAAAADDSHRCCACGKAGGPAAEGQAAPEGYYNHPRFHPVPTQPVFTPRLDPLAAARPNHVDLQEDDPLSVPNRLPEPAKPEAIPIPPPGPAESGNKGQASPDRLATTSADTSTWLFSPPLPPSAGRGKKPAVEAQSDSLAVDQRTLR
jgi:hypothetical protein